MNAPANVAVVGATGAVGEEMLKVLAERGFPIGEIKALASERSAGKEVDFGEAKLVVEELREDSFAGVDLALFSAGGSISKAFAPLAVQAGTIVVDNSSAFRMDDDVPLVVPEVNPDDVGRHKGIIANPNCSTIQMVVVLKPLHDAAGIKRIVVSTYQAVSGTGKNAVAELLAQTEAVLAGEEPAAEVYPHQIAFNVLPHIDVFLDDGYTKEEKKMEGETKKIMGDDSIQVTATCARVPVLVGHSESVNLETREHLAVEEARRLLDAAPGVVVVDDPAANAYPLAVDAAGKDPSYVGRLRRDPTVPNGLNMWIVSDNVRKGAALNAVQIAELLLA